LNFRQNGVDSGIANSIEFTELFICAVCSRAAPSPISLSSAQACRAITHLTMETGTETLMVKKL